MSLEAIAATPSDHQLVDAFLDGDASAFALIVERHRPRLLRLAKRYTYGNTADAEDVLQEAFFRAARNLDNFRAEATLSTWLHRLVMNCGYDFTHHRFRREISTLDTDEINPDYDDRLAVDQRDRPEDSVALRIALSQLTPDHRRALLAVDAVGLSVEEFALHEGIKPGTVKSRRARARTALAEALKEQSVDM